MRLKTKITIISFGTIFVLLVIIEFISYSFASHQFQTIENQRVERNIRRVSAIIEDQLNQINIKLSDWSIWDDTYVYLADKNQAYENSNLGVETFKALEVDEALFIDKDGQLVKEIHTDEEKIDLFSYFTNGNSLIKIDEDKQYKAGILNKNNRALLFVNQGVYHSDGSGEKGGNLIFAVYFDEEIMLKMEELTQFKVKMVYWDDSQMAKDFSDFKNEYLKNNKENLVKPLDENIISGYLLVKDINNEPILIVRSDIARDIRIKGKTSLNLLMNLFIVAGLIIAIINYFLLNNILLKKILLITEDVEELGKIGREKYLKINNNGDEIDGLRNKINEMISLMTNEKQKGEGLIDLIDALVVILDPEGKIMTINKKALKILGYKKEELVGKNWFETCIPPQIREEVINAFKYLISIDAEEISTNFDNLVTTKDSKSLLIAWHNTTAKDPDSGKITATLSIGEDITLKSEHEKKKEEYAEELEKINKLMVDRELKMIELKEKLKKFNG